MADNEKPQQSAQGPGYQNAALPAQVLNVLNDPAFPAALLEVLVRGIELAQQQPVAPDPGGTGDAKALFCAYAYAEPGQGCLLAYWKPAA